MKSINLPEMKALIEQSAVIIDTRHNNAFIGWKVDGAKSRGHIEGAINFSANWLAFLDKAVLSKHEKDERNQALDNRFRNLPLINKPVILYDNNGKDAQRIAAYFKEQGLDDLYYFNLNHWEDNLIYYPNYHQLVAAEWVLEVINNEDPSQYKIYEVNWGKESITFLASHIPGAIHINSEEFEISPSWVHADFNRLAEFIYENGITHDKKLIFYSTGDQGAEYKTALLLNFLGYQNTYVLNGGYSAWRLKGFTTERGSVTKPMNGDKLTTLTPVKPQNITYIDQVKDYLRNQQAQIIDVRSWKEYRAEESGYDYIPIAGRIPATQWGGPWIEYKNIDDTMRNIEEIREIWQHYHIDPNKPMIYFCGSAGWGAAMLVYFLEVADIFTGSIYEGGWCEWQLDPNNPIETQLLNEGEI